MREEGVRGHFLVSDLRSQNVHVWRRKWQPTPVFLPGESQGRGTLVGCRLWGRTESNTTEVTAAAAENLQGAHLLRHVL